MTWPKARICAAAQMTEPGSKHDHHQPLHARRIALPEEVGKRGEPARPQRLRKQQADDDDGRRVSQRIDEGPAASPFSYTAPPEATIASAPK